MPWLVAGLGNPGPKYSGNRHNIGFMVADEIARLMGERFTAKFKGEVARGRFGEQDVLVLKPMTYMNLSGVSVGGAASFFKIPLEQVVVIHDELDLPYEQVRVKVGGGHAGHNGLRSIFQHFGREFVRVRCGIGRPVHGEVTDFVLSDFSTGERVTLPHLVEDGARAVELIVSRGPLAAMNELHPQQKQRDRQREN